LPALPAWAGAHSWAPHVDRVGNRYLLYFATQIDGSPDFAVAVASSRSPLGPFLTSSHPVVTGHELEALDPFVLDMPNRRHILYWGSWGSPLQAAALTRNGMALAESPHPVLFPDPSGSTPYERLIEAPWVLPHGGQYYLMYSGDRCCWSDAHYAVMVARSPSPYGPFVRDPNNPILAGNRAFRDPGHNATITDAIGQDWIVYHAMRPPDDADRVLMMDRIDWTQDGWPVINGGSGPSNTPVAAPIVR
jgi:arabinan endo-1,5-alpha-L-arabinosidase